LLPLTIHVALASRAYSAFNRHPSAKGVEVVYRAVTAQAQPMTTRRKICIAAAVVVGVIVVLVVRDSPPPITATFVRYDASNVVVRISNRSAFSVGYHLHDLPVVFDIARDTVEEWAVPLTNWPPAPGSTITMSWWKSSPDLQFQIKRLVRKFVGDPNDNGYNEVVLRTISFALPPPLKTP